MAVLESLISPCKRKGKKSYCNTGYSCLVTQPMTNFSEQGLTLLNRRNMLLSFFGPVSLGPSFEKFQKTGDFGVLAESVITRRCGHFWSRDLVQNVMQGLLLMRILIIRLGHLRQSVFQAPKVGLFFNQFPLVPLWKNSENWRFRCPCRIGHNGTMRSLLGPRILRKILSKVCT